MNLRKYFSTPLMEFYCAPELFGVIPEPVPSIKMVPEWFKKVPVSMGAAHRDQFGGHGMTAKKCLPLLDAMSVGVIIPLWGDVNIRTNDEGSLIEASRNPLGDVVQFHSKEQLGGKTSPTYPGPAVKFINRWVIKTAPGYSTLFIPPINHIEPRFTCLSGIVDTDKYPKEVNFPAIWHAKGYDGIVAAGTPIVTCIAVRRSDLHMDVSPRAMTEKERKTIEIIQMKQTSRSHVYTKELREARK